MNKNLRNWGQNKKIFSASQQKKEVTETWDGIWIMKICSWI